PRLSVARRSVRATAPGLLAAFLVAFLSAAPGAFAATAEKAAEPAAATPDYWSLVFVFVLSTFIGIGAIARVSRLLHTPLMSLTNAISAIAVVGSILVTGGDHPPVIRVLGAIALFASMTNIVSGFMITDRMLKMFRRPDVAAAKPGGTQPNGAKP
ncbi:MAG TPA: NAD(P) transhydrogenase subunit alpha, partial [Planctomycetota bacterium]|nr:NAD(P) transhydrogenase subunit alpha [Planctomycetota bacterium]